MLHLDEPIEVEIAEGGTLVLNEDGTIDYYDEEGECQNTWPLEDLDWGRQASVFAVTRADFL
jgi:hypothetical protein